MGPPAAARLLILAIGAPHSFIDFRGGARREMDFEQRVMAGRIFGGVLVWLLMAGLLQKMLSL